MLSKPVTEYLTANRQPHLEALLDLLRIPSVSNHSDGACEQAAQWLRDRLGGLGFQARVVPTACQPAVLASREDDPSLPTLLVYGHYDVQPLDPLELWDSDPFDPQVRDGRIYARGANDDKGQLMAQLAAVEAWVRADLPLPVNLRFFIEGEEEIGSPSLESFLADHAEALAADAVVISDSEFFARGVPSLTVALRGLLYMQIDVQGPDRDLHSGIHGGAVENPLNALAALLGSLHDESGRVAVEGFYDGVGQVGAEELAEWEQLPFSEAEYARSLGIPAVTGGEEGLSVLQRRWARPTLDVNGVWGGYQGPGSKTVIPARAGAKLSCRLVAGQEPQAVFEAIRRHLRDRAPAGVQLTIEAYGQARPVEVAPDSPVLAAGLAALEEAFEAPARKIRCGASVPVTEAFQRVLGIPPVLMGFGLPDDNIHSPNEKFDLEQFYKGAHAAAAFIQNLAGAVKR